MDNFKRLFFAGALGLGVGAAMEYKTDYVAEKKIITAEVCEDIYPMDGRVTQAYHDCITEGVPTGMSIGADKLKVNQPEAYVDAYMDAQEAERGLETERLLIWTAGAIAVRALMSKVR